jgi:hypothetical protein
MQELSADGLSGLCRESKSLACVDDFCSWIKRFDTLQESVRVVLRAGIKAIATKPLFSTVMPAYNSNLSLEHAYFSLAWLPRLKPVSLAVKFKSNG